MTISASTGWVLGLVCVVLTLATAAVYRAAGLGPVLVAPGAALRAVAQLAVVAAVLAAALTHLWSSILVLAIMFGAAAGTAGRRSRAGRSGAWLAASLAVGWLTVMLLLLGTGTVPMSGASLVPIGGVILGGTMTATSLAARRALDALDQYSGEVEAALSLGFGEHEARLEVIRPTVADALLPGVDQTRTVGLVTLPGAFVGVLVASGSAVQAAVVQILVLLGLLLSQSCAVAVTIQLVAHRRVRRTSNRGRMIAPAL